MTEHELYYMRLILRHLQEFKKLINKRGAWVSSGSDVLADHLNWLDSFITRQAGEHQ